MGTPLQALQELYSARIAIVSMTWPRFASQHQDGILIGNSTSVIVPLLCDARPRTPFSGTPFLTRVALQTLLIALVATLNNPSVTLLGN